MPALTNARHEAFAQGLAKGLTASEAYVAAGYKESRSAASRLSTNVNVSARVAELVTKGGELAEIDVARVLKELVRLGTSDIRDAFTDDGALKPPKAWSDDFAAAVASVEVASRNLGKDADGNTEVEHVHKLKVWDKNSALEKLGKYLSMFIERRELTGKDGGAIETKDVTPRDIIASRIAGLAAREGEG